MGTSCYVMPINKNVIERAGLFLSGSKVYCVKDHKWLNEQQLFLGDRDVVKVS